MQEEMLSIFLEESQEHLQALGDNLLLLEKEPTAMEIISDIFRSAHTFKGMAATMEFHQMAELTHAMENVLDEIRHGNLIVNTEIVDIIFECTDVLEKMIEDVRQGGIGDFEVAHIIKELRCVKNGEIDVEPNLTNDFLHTMKINFATDAQLKSVRAIMCIDKVQEYGVVQEVQPPVEKIEKEEFDFEIVLIFSLVEEGYKDELHKTILNITDVQDVQFISEEKEADAREEKTTAKPKNKTTQKAAAALAENKSIRVQLEKIEQLMNVFEESVVERGKIEDVAQRLKQKELTEHLNRLADTSKEIQNLLLSMRMVPIETVFNRYPKMVRTLSKELGKKIDLVITGEDTEVDKIVIDEIGDPLVHLIRNAVDHGIETVEERKTAGKPETGTVRLKAFHSGNNVVIEVSEDGHGINKDSVLKKAIKNNIVSESEAAKLSDPEIYELILKPGFSTAEVISDISGRGVGLDVVKTTITKLGGTLSVSSELGAGSIFRIELPLTLSIIQAMLIKTKSTRYAIPLGNIVEAMKINKSQIQTLDGREVINYRDKIIEVVRLDEVFNEEQHEDESPDMSLLILKNTKRTYGLAIDSINTQREIVLKTLGDFFSDSVTYFSGATILGDGRVVLILNPDAF